MKNKFNKIRTQTACVVLLLMVCPSLTACASDNGMQESQKGQTWKIEMPLFTESEDDSYETTSENLEPMEDLPCPEEGKVKADSIQPGETVLAVRYVNGAWGDQNMFIVIDKEGNCKFQDRSTWENGVKEVEDLLSCLDDCLADEDIPYAESGLDLSKEMLETVVSTQDFELEPARWEQCDAGEMKCYAVCGSGRDRTLVCMQQDGDFESRSRYRNVRKLCEEMLELYNKLEEIYWAGK